MVWGGGGEILSSSILTSFQVTFRMNRECYILFLWYIFLHQDMPKKFTWRYNIIESQNNHFFKFKKLNKSCFHNRDYVMYLLIVCVQNGLCQ